jgi:HEAT repeat protein
VDAGAIQALLRILPLSEGAVVERACGAIENICWTTDGARETALDAGTVPILLGLLSDPSDRIKESAASALRVVCSHEPAAAAAQRAGVVPILCHLLASDDTNLLKSIMGCLHAITHGSAAKLAKTEALDSGSVPAIMRHLDAGTRNVYEYGSAVIRNITFLEEAEMPVAEAGALNSLVKVLSSTESNALQRACEAIKNICRSQDTAKKKAFDAGAIPALVGHLSNDNVRVQDSAAFALWKVCLHEPAAVAAHAANAVPLIINLMGSSDKSLQISAIGAMYAITSGGVSPDIKLAALREGALPVLVKILNSDRTDVYETSAAVVCNIVGVTEAQAPAVTAGAIPALVKLLASCYVNVRSRAREALRNLGWCAAPEAKEELFDDSLIGEHLLAFKKYVRPHSLMVADGDARISRISRLVVHHCGTVYKLGVYYVLNNQTTVVREHGSPTIPQSELAHEDIALGGVYPHRPKLIIAESSP